MWQSKKCTINVCAQGCGILDGCFFGKNFESVPNGFFLINQSINKADGQTRQNVKPRVQKLTSWLPQTAGISFINFPIFSDGQLSKPKNLETVRSPELVG